MNEYAFAAERLQVCAITSPRTDHRNVLRNYASVVRGFLVNNAPAGEMRLHSVVIAQYV